MNKRRQSREQHPQGGLTSSGSDIILSLYILYVSMSNPNFQSFIFSCCITTLHCLSSDWAGPLVAYCKTSTRKQTTKLKIIGTHISAAKSTPME
ncbi:hypothetical protein YC2023_025587 [Brassica napus]